MSSGSKDGPHESSVRLGLGEVGYVVPDDGRFDVLVIADLYATNVAPELGARKPVRIDRDVFEDVLAKLGVACSLDLGPLGGVQPLEFAEWDDFHPDAIVDRFAAFRELRDLRKQAKEELSESARRVALWGESRTEPGTLAAILEAAVRKHLVAPANPRQEQLLRCVEQAMEETLRFVCAQDAYRELETVWRALRDLVHAVETGPALQIHVLHATRAELLATCATDGPLGETALARVLGKAAETSGFRVVLWPYDMAPRGEELQLLSDLGLIAGSLGAALLAGASPALLGIESLRDVPDPKAWSDGCGAAGLDALWQALRATPQARHMALFAPRYLTRLPYGAATDPIDRFPFEELEPDRAPRLDQLRYASSAWIATRLLARAFARLGEGFSLGEEVQVESVPMHVLSIEGEPREISASEAILREAALKPLMDRGINPVVGFQGEDRLRVASWHSLHVSGETVRGAWRS